MKLMLYFKIRTIETGRATYIISGMSGGRKLFFFSLGLQLQTSTQTRQQCSSVILLVDKIIPTRLAISSQQHSGLPLTYNLGSVLCVWVPFFPPVEHTSTPKESVPGSSILCINGLRYWLCRCTAVYRYIKIEVKALWSQKLRQRNRSRRCNAHVHRTGYDRHDIIRVERFST